MTPEPIPHPAEALRKVVTAALRFSDRAAGEGIFFIDGGDPSEFLYEAYAQCENPLDELVGRVSAALTPDPTKAGQADEVAGLRAVIETLRGNISALSHGEKVALELYGEARQRATAAEARNKVLEEALRPFQDDLIGLDGRPPLSTEGLPVEHSSNDALIPVYIKKGDRIRALRARSALSQAREGGEHGE